VLLLVLVSAHFVLKVGEEASFLGPSKFINFVVVNLVLTKVGLLSSNLVESSSLGQSVST
jgi:hypothetical protein